MGNSNCASGKYDPLRDYKNIQTQLEIGLSVPSGRTRKTMVLWYKQRVAEISAAEREFQGNLERAKTNGQIEPRNYFEWALFAQQNPFEEQRKRIENVFDRLK